MRVLFLDPEQYVDFENEAANYEVRLPMLHSGAITAHADFVYQRIFNWHGPLVFHRFTLTEIDAFRPDVVVFLVGWYNQCPKIETLREIRSRGIAIFSVIFDSMRQPEEYELALFEESDGFCIVNSFTNYCRYRHWAESRGEPKAVVFSAGHMVWTGFFKPMETEKTRDVLILGSLYRRRLTFTRELAKILEPEGIRVEALGGNFHDLPDTQVECGNPTDGPMSKLWLPWVDYRSAILSSRICLCPTAADDRDVLNGKIFEFIASGVCTLTEWNPSIEMLAGQSGIGLYRALDDCVDMIRRLMADEAARKAAAEGALAWYRRHFDPSRFWRTSLEATHARQPIAAPVDFLEAKYQTERAKMAPSPESLLSLF